MAHYNVDEEVRLIHMHTERVSKEKGRSGMEATFGEIFSDSQVEQVFESLVGSLKAAKRRGILDFPGQLLLMPTHKDTMITLKEPYDDSKYQK